MFKMTRVQGRSWMARLTGGRVDDEQSSLARRRALMSAGAQVTVLLRSIEDLSPTSRRELDAVLDRQILVRKNPWLSRLDPRITRLLVDERMDAPLAAVSAGASAILLVRRKRDRLTAVLEATQLAITLQQSLRSTGVGRDGSDHALIVTQSGLLASSILEPFKGERLGLWFVGAQGYLAYLVSGVVKLWSPLWRHGIGLSGPLQALSFGHAGLHRFLTLHPAVRQAAAWSVIVLETGYPLVIVLPKNVGRVWSAGLLVMHLGIAYFMGLNRFLPAFASMHPATLGMRDDVQRFLGVGEQ